MRWKLAGLVAILVFLASGAAVWVEMREGEPSEREIRIEEKVATALPAPQEMRPADFGQSVENEAPFTSQAPLGQWGDPRQQDACEEAAALMAVKWARDEEIASPEAAREEILAISKFQTEKYGKYRDTSAADTVERIFKDYYGFDLVEYRAEATIESIVAELQKGDLVITPMNGQALLNRHYTGAGPERHMILITGYDAATKEFITNDAGTVVGKNYRYNVDLFFAAIRDYPTGNYVPIEGEIRDMIVVKRV